MPNRNIEGNYRYKYQGQEKDPETGMEAFELRLWDSRIGRWITTDPAGQFYSPYLGMGNNPINGVDPDGGCFTTDADGNTIPCPDNMAVGSTITGIDGFEYTMQENNVWWSDAAFEQKGSDLGMISSNSFSKQFMYMLEFPFKLAHELHKSIFPRGVTFWGNPTNKGTGGGTNGTKAGLHFNNENLPAGGGAKTTRWKDLANKGDDAVRVVKGYKGAFNQGGKMGDIVEPMLTPVNNSSVNSTIERVTFHFHDGTTDSTKVKIDLEAKTIKGLKRKEDSIDNLNNISRNRAKNWYNND